MVARDVLARQPIRQRHEGGDGLATAGLISGIIGTAGYLLICLSGVFANA